MILRLSHIEIGADDLAAARAFYVDLLGFIEHDSEPNALYLRGGEEFDLWSLKVTGGLGGGLVHSCFRVAASTDLEELISLHRQLGLRAVHAPGGSEPGQGDAVRVTTADGHRVEFVHDVQEIDPYRSGRLVLPMRDRHLGRVLPARIDHVSMRVPDIASALSYWIDRLDFSASEFWLGDDDRTPRVAWLRRSPRSHDVALGADCKAGFHHFAYAVADSYALLRAADLIGDAHMQDRLEWGPSRHGATNAMAMYVSDPSGNRVELYCGDYMRDLDRPALLWHPDDYRRQGHSWWGHSPPDSFPSTQPLVGTWPI